MEAARVCTVWWGKLALKKLLLELGWEPLFKRREWNKLIYMSKIVHRLSPLYLSQICQPTASSTRYATRGANSIRVPRCRTSYFILFFPSFNRYWNSLDYSIRNLDSSSLFKRRIKDKFSYKRPPPHYYSGLRAASIWHTRLRIGMSQLSAHLISLRLCWLSWMFLWRNTWDRFSLSPGLPPLCCSTRETTGCN